MKRPTAVFARTAVTISKQIPFGGNVVPNVKSMDYQREPKAACDAILQAVGQRSQLISEVLDMINEAFVHDSRRRICVEFGKRQGGSC